MIEYDRYNDCDSIRIINEHYCYNDCDFTFEDEVNLSHKIYGKRRKNYCDTFRLKLYGEIIKLERLKNKIVENLITIMIQVLFPMIIKGLVSRPMSRVLVLVPIFDYYI